MTITANCIRNVSFSILTLFIINSCQSQISYDPELMTPDNDSTGVNHGFNYTALGCFLAYPWKYLIVTIDTSVQKGEYSGKPIKQIKEELLFEPQKDGSLKYWFSSDYLVSPIDTITLADGNKSIVINGLKSKDLKIKKIYNTGSWSVNFKDSIISIDFGKNNFGLNLIKGKYDLLTAEFLNIWESSSGISSNSTNIEKNKERNKYHQFVHY